MACRLRPWILSSRRWEREKLPSMGHLENVSRRVLQQYRPIQTNTGIGDRLLSEICRKIRFSGPISVAQYMKDVLTDSHKGYYIHGDMVGSHGDFITSPELNQMFGELIAIWFITEWQALGSPKSFRFVEFGPGRGTLADDILKTFQRFQKIFKDAVMSFHFVEISKKLSDIQYQSLCDTNTSNKAENLPESFQSGFAKRTGVPLHWHHSIENIPNDKFTFFLAHEFFDALPIHKFVRTIDGWREIYVDLKAHTEDALHFIQMPEITLATRLVKGNDRRNHVEISPESGTIIANIAERIETKGGASLIIDYGHTGEKEDTLRGFKDHKLNDVFENVGEADLTADVDFNFLLESTKPFQVKRSGPMSQQNFLKNMGIELRLLMLLRGCKNLEDRRKLVDSCKIMMDEKHMGERFKFLALTSKHRQDKSPVTGFYSHS